MILNVLTLYFLKLYLKLIKHLQTLNIKIFHQMFIELIKKYL